MPTNLISVNAYAINGNSNNVPIRVGLPVSRMEVQGVSQFVNNTQATFKTIPVGSTNVNCYATVFVGNNYYLVQETPASLVTMANV